MIVFYLIMKIFLSLIIMLCQLKAAMAESKADLLKSIIGSYTRSVTVLSLSNESDSLLESLCSTYPQSVFIGNSEEAFSNPDNLILYDSDLSPTQISSLALHEHVDLAYFFGICAYKQNAIDALLRLADHVILEFPKELYDLMTDFFQKRKAQILIQDRERIVVLLKRQKYKFFKDLSKNEDVRLMTSHHYAVICSNDHLIPQDVGISLYGFMLLNGSFPTREMIAESIKTYKWGPDGACLPWNILLQGKALIWRKRFFEPLAWTKEAVSHCLQGLSITDPIEYIQFTKKQLQTLRIAK